MEEAKSILKDRNNVTSFMERYGCNVYTGIFAAGGWFRTIATAVSSEEMEFEVLAKEARRKLDANLTLGFASKSGAVGVGLKGGNMKGESEDINLQMTQSSVNVTTKKESAPGNTISADDLEIKIKSAENWTVLPVDQTNPESKKKNYLPIHEVLKIQADDTKDIDLGQAAKIIKERMSLRPTETPTTQRQMSIPKMHPDSTYDFKFMGREKLALVKIPVPKVPEGHTIHHWI